MKKNIILLSLSGIVFLLLSCGQTRVEEDVFTITKRDTTYQNFVHNAPGNRDNGAIVPSSKTFKNERVMTQIDSSVERKYPDFIRFGLFESIGLIGSSSENKTNAGPFGLFPDPKDLNEDFTGYDDGLFSGGLYRFGIYENRLRWFRDAKNWSWGFNIFEYISKDAYTNHALISLIPVFIKKRYYLREEIPYIAVSLSGGLGIFPSRYLNLSGSLDIGSIGGLNLKTYVGFIAGVNPTNSPQVAGGNTPKKSESMLFPYLGIGVSVLDFHNLPSETERQWKEYEHSSWNVGFLQFGMLNTGSEFAYGSDSADKDNFFKGMLLKIANASVALPILNNQFYAGTSLLNLLVLGKNEWGLSILPIRVGYWQTVLLDELSVEPFLEYNYYPSSFFNFGGRVNLALVKAPEEGDMGYFNVSFVFGYASGTTDLGFGKDVVDFLGLPGDFSQYYFGLSIGIVDRILFDDQLRYNK